MVMYIVAATYAFAYMLISGILQYTGNFDISTVVPVPSLKVYFNGPIGTVPWIIAFLSDRWFFSMNLSAALFTTASSALVGLTVALLIYNSRMPRCDCSKQKALGSAAFVTGFLAQFSCCGGGVMLLTIVSLFGPAGWSVFLRATNILIAMTLVILVLNVWFITTRINQRLYPKIG